MKGKNYVANNSNMELNYIKPKCESVLPSNLNPMDLLIQLSSSIKCEAKNSKFHLNLIVD